MTTEFATGELWYLDRAGVLNTAFTAASTFVGSATKLRHHEIDLSELVQEVYEDKSIQTAPDGKPAGIPGRRNGAFKFKMYLEGGSSTTTASTLAALLGCGLGGIRSPTAISDAVDDTNTTSTQIYATAHGMYRNDMVLIGTDGDAKGGGRLGVIEDNSEADSYDLQMALPGTPVDTDTIKNGHTVFIDFLADQQYQDFLFIGSHAGGSASDDPDSCQMLGCGLAGVAFGGLAEGEPWIELTYNVAQWQWVNYSDQATFAYATDASGGDPVGGAEAGALCLQDASSTTRNEITGAEIEIEIPLELRMVVDHNYANDCGGWKKVPAGGPTLTVKPYWEDIADMPGLYNDVQNKTAKQVLYQIGNTSQGTVGIYMQRAFFQPIAPGQRVGVDDLTGIELKLIGDSGRASDLSDVYDRQRDAAIVISFN